MAHFALVNAENIVVEVLVVPNEQEHRGHDFLANDLKVEMEEGSRWLQCSYNNNIRGVFPSDGFAYDPVEDVFIGNSADPILVQVEEPFVEDDDTVN